MFFRLNALPVVVVEEHRIASVTAELVHLMPDQILVAAVNQFAVVVVLLKELLDLADRSLVLFLLSLPTVFYEFLAFLRIGWSCCRQVAPTVFSGYRVLTFLVVERDEVVVGVLVTGKIPQLVFCT